MYQNYPNIPGIAINLKYYTNINILPIWVILTLKFVDKLQRLPLLVLISYCNKLTLQILHLLFY